MVQKPTPADGDQPVRYRVLSGWAIAAWAVLIVLVGVGMAVWLLLAYTGGNPDANRAQLDAIRTAGTVVVGTGGAAALLLAARRQRTAEIALKQKDRDQADVARAHALQERVAAETRAHQERVAQDTREDAVARRITEEYTKAADQLGSDKAPVRLAGLYALERLAQNNIDQRQTIVNLLCAYLRMPYTLPGDPPADDTDHTLVDTHRERVQEREVRLTAQRILTDHLRLPSTSSSGTEQPDTAPPASYWADINIDLTNATLIDLHFSHCHVHTASFVQATYSGDTWFNRARFSGAAWFNEAQFGGDAGFHEVQFEAEAGFGGARFDGDATFGRARFDGGAWFGDVQFSGHAWFYEARFSGPASFGGVHYSDMAAFGGAQFNASADFSKAQFDATTEFDETQFGGYTRFDAARFNGETNFGSVSLPTTRYTGSATPLPWTSFADTRFDRGGPQEVAGFVSEPPLDARQPDEA